MGVAGSLYIFINFLLAAIGTDSYLKRAFIKVKSLTLQSASDSVNVFDNVIDANSCNTLSASLLNYAVHNRDVVEYSTPLSIPFRVFNRCDVQSSNSHNDCFKTIEFVIDSILTALQDDSQYVEYWWRGHWSNHVLHRDVDELLSMKYDTQRFPRNAHVLYLNFEEMLANESGGHTVVLEDSGNPKRNLFIVPPLPGRLLRFEGRLLHGVPRPALEYFLHDQSKESVEIAVDTILNSINRNSINSCLNISQMSFSCDFSLPIFRSVILFNTWPDKAPDVACGQVSDNENLRPLTSSVLTINPFNEWKKRHFQSNGKIAIDEKPLGNMDDIEDFDWVVRFLLPADRRRRDSYEKSLPLRARREDVAAFLIHDATDRPPSVISLMEMATETETEIDMINS